MKIFSLYLDFDNTIVNSTKAFVEIYNKKLNRNEDWRICRRYDFKDLFPNVTSIEIEKTFESNEFFDNIEFMDGFLETYNKIKDKIEINMASYGNELNISKKKKWLTDKMEYNNFYSFHSNDNCHHDKSNVNMFGSVFIDDTIECLRSSNASIKILFKNYIDNNKNQIDNLDDVYVVNSWKEIEEILLFYINNGGIL